MDSIREITELQRLLTSMIRIGKVVAADYAAARVTVQIGDITTAPLPFMTQRAGENRNWSPVEVGEQVLLVCPSGDIDQAVVVGSLYQTSYPAPQSLPTVTTMVFKDGAEIEYDRVTHKLVANLPSGGTFDVTADGGITLNGDVTINGNTAVNGDVNVDGLIDATGEITGSGIDLSTHTHSGVASGSSSTGGPQ
ncbi:phage baseplate assembly protein V [Emcibacter sp.]|uniref:phage baseplate assembly protein V n=1 Tax=Emcibacter sp. TaxID=1979954 RepID=UPI002AA96124|nr:phage baseplate assembly protein V [Emcibacter sp.]